ncbi:MAG: winged helix-turn-helix domain-containing protein, partial [Acidobacteria bacterium]|nr:winged helix-turn-helix domain-containing protein [Acidobacteriota bacterium]
MTRPDLPVAYRFGPFRLDVRDRLLESNGERIALTPKVIDTLFVLIENRGQVVSKEDLMKSVWPDVTVVESGLTRNLSVLRKALESDTAEGTYIETIPKRGYRFVASVDEDRIPDAPVIASPKRSNITWIVLTAVVICVLAAFLLVARKTRPTPVEPLVRIGDHLLYKLSPDAMSRAVAQFEQAIAANPNSAGAHSGLSIALLGLIEFGARANRQAGPVALAAARRAVALDPNSCTAHSALALTHLVHRWDFAAAESEFRKALAADPQSVQARLLYARLKIATGKLPEARLLVEEALALDPASPPLGTEYCRVFYFLRDFQRAAAECRKVLDREPGFALAHYYLAMTLGSSGQIEEARNSLRQSGLRPEVIEADQAWLSALQGDPKPAEAVLESRRQLMRQGKVDATAKLLPAVILGRADEAYEALSAAIANRAPECLSIPLEPRLDPLRKDPRYAAAL